MLNKVNSSVVKKDRFEFQVNDIVTFVNPSNKKITGKIINRGFSKRGFSFGKHIWYELRGVSESLITVTSPRSILESQYEYTENHL